MAYNPPSAVERHELYVCRAYLVLPSPIYALKNFSSSIFQGEPTNIADPLLLEVKIASTSAAPLPSSTWISLAVEHCHGAHMDFGRNSDNRFPGASQAELLPMECLWLKENQSRFPQ